MHGYFVATRVNESNRSEGSEAALVVEGEIVVEVDPAPSPSQTVVWVQPPNVCFQPVAR